jgi:hypothetical protein
VAISDTTAAAQAIQDEIHRKMSGEQRILLGFEMSMFTREIARAGIQQQHPDWPQDRVARELLRLAFLPEPLPAGFRAGLPEPSSV